MAVVPEAPRRHLRTLVVWVVVVLVVYALVSFNRSREARQEAALASPQQTARDAAVLHLIKSGGLMDALSNTQDPTEDPASPRNTRSIKIRQNAADTVNSLAQTHAITTAQALDTLFQLRKDGDQGVKDRATNGIATLGAQSDDTLNAIVQRMKDGDPDIRGAAVDALSGGKIAPAKAAQKIDMLLKDPAAQDSAKSALLKIGLPAAPFLAARLHDPKEKDVEFRQQLVDMLGKIAAPSSVPDLMQVAATDVPSVRRMALLSLSNIVLTMSDALRNATDAVQKANTDPKKTPQTIAKAQADAAKAAADFAQVSRSAPTLIAALGDQATDSEARAQSALVLGRIGGPQAIAALVKALGDYDSRIQQSALAGVESAGPPAVPPLLTVLSQGSESARAAAAEALGGIGNAPAIAAIGRVFADPATPITVRRSATVGLGRSGSAATIPALVAALGDPDGGVASAASQGLLAPQLAPAAIPQLIAAFGKPTPVPFNASQTLTQMGDQAIPALETASRSANPATQTWAAVTLGQTDSKNPAVVSALKPLANSADPHVKWAAQQALNRVSGA